MPYRWIGFLGLLLVAGWTGIALAEDVVTIGDLLKSPGAYQAKTVIVRGTVRGAPRYRGEDPTCGAPFYLHRFQFVDENGAIGVVALGCLHGTIMVQGGPYEQLYDGMKLEVMGRVSGNASGVTIESIRMGY